MTADNIIFFKDTQREWRLSRRAFGTPHNDGHFLTRSHFSAFASIRNDSFFNKKPAKSLSQARLFKTKRDFVKIFTKICIFHLQTAEKYVRFKMLKHIIHCLITITIINENVFYSNLWVKSFRWILLFLIRRLYTLSGHDMVGLSTVLHWYGFQPLSTLSNFSIIEMMQHL
ncbi:MAG: hypothetical protein IKN71_07235 [Alphaproteobacteria bacterium]|nr:hypothetical protein [Alphaproteobacteria bacterium]